MIKIFSIYVKDVILKFVLGTIRNAHESATDEHISGPIKIWLAHAKERIDREKEKRRKDENNENEEPKEGEKLC